MDTPETISWAVIAFWFAVIIIGAAVAWYVGRVIVGDKRDARMEKAERKEPAE